MSVFSSSLKQWTGKAKATIIFDSTVDEFTGEVLFDAIKGKQNIALISFTTDGDVFGGYHSVAVTKQSEEFYDPTIFAFSFESHGRCMTPQRFMVHERSREKGYAYYRNGSSGFASFQVGEVGCFWLGNEKSDSYCWWLSRMFDGLDDTTFSGKLGDWGGPFHHNSRLVAVHLS